MTWTSTSLWPAWVVTLLLPLGLVGGCGSEPSDQATEPEVNPSPSSSQTPTSPTPSGPTPSGPAGKAAADLAARLGVDAASVEVVGEESVTWNDGSLGCAEPGMVYTEALVEGSRITVQADGVSYEYHAGGSTEPFWCEEPTE